LSFPTRRSSDLPHFPQHVTVAVDPPHPVHPFQSKKKNLSIRDKQVYCHVYPHRGSTISLMAVRSSPSIMMSVKAGMQIRSMPLGATNPRAIATAFTA